MTAVLGGKRLDPALLLQAHERTVQRARLQDRPAEAPDVLEHGVAVLLAIREAEQDEQRDVGEAAKVSKVGAHVGPPSSSTQRPHISRQLLSTTE